MMNILTFDLEEWYVYELHKMGTKDYYLPILNRLLDELLNLLDKKNIKATFFCLGIVAREYPNVIKSIANKGHEIGCHSDQHKWLTQFSPKEFEDDTKRAIESLEQIIGKKVISYRAPAFSIGKENLWVLDILSQNGIERDCSIFPAARDFGGFPEFSEQSPALIIFNGITIKEFPIRTANFFRKKMAYSGGGYFRLFPYQFIKKNMQNNNYTMTYFHLRDFDKVQKRHVDLRYFKNYYGINQASEKFNKLILDFDFMNVEAADKIVDWTNCFKFYF